MKDALRRLLAYRRSCLLTELPAEGGALGSRASGARLGEVGDADAGVDEGLELSDDDAAAKLGKHALNEPAVDRADDVPVGVREFEEGAAVHGDVPGLRAGGELGLKAKLALNTQKLRDRLGLRERAEGGGALDEVAAPGLTRPLGALGGIIGRACQAASEDLGEKTVASQFVRPASLGLSLVEETGPTGMGSALASDRDEASVCEEAHVRADGVHVEAYALGEFAGVKGSTSLLKDLEETEAARVAQRGVDAGASARRLGACSRRHNPDSTSLSGFG